MDNKTSNPAVINTIPSQSAESNKSNEPKYSFQDVDSARRKYAKKLIIALVPALTLFLIACISVVISIFSFKQTSAETTDGRLSLVAFLLTVVISLCVVIFTRKDSARYKELYKEFFVKQSLNQLFTNIVYVKSQGISPELIYSTGMIRRGNRYSSNDYVSAKYKNVGFTQSDVRIANEDDDTETLIFKGRWLRFEFPKSFNFRLEVVEKRFFANRTPSKNYKTGKSFQKIKTESQSFNRKFNIYAEDGFEAFYILDPVFIEHIEALESIHKGKIILCFIDNYLHVGIKNNKDAFEPPNPTLPLNESKEIDKVTKDLKLITDFVDFLKLDKKLFKS